MGSVELEKVNPGEGVICQECFFHKDFIRLCKHLGEKEYPQCGITSLAEIEEEVESGKQRCQEFVRSKSLTLEDLYFEPWTARFLIALAGSYPT